MSHFSQDYDETIRDLERKLDQFIDDGEEFEIERSGDVLTIEFEDGEKIVITPQAPTEQLWVSANYSGHRFNWNGGEWENEKNGEEFLVFLSRTLSEKLGSLISLT